jgi:hypothetical protein
VAVWSGHTTGFEEVPADTFILELEDGTEVEAFAGQESFDDAVIGDELRIEFDEVADGWIVLEQLESRD